MSPHPQPTPRKAPGPLVILRLEGISWIQLEAPPLGIRCLGLQRLPEGSLQDTLSSEFRLPVWLGWGWGIWPRATAPQPAHCLPCGRKRLLPRAGGAWGTLTQLRLRICADATGHPPPHPVPRQHPGAWIMGLGEGNQTGPPAGKAKPKVGRLDTAGRPPPPAQSPRLGPPAYLSILPALPTTIESPS